MVLANPQRVRIPGRKVLLEILLDVVASAKSVDDVEHSNLEQVDELMGCFTTVTCIVWRSLHTNSEPDATCPRAEATR